MLVEEIEGYKHSFNEVWKKEIFPYLNWIEPDRKKRFSKMILLSSLLLLICFVTVFLALTTNDESNRAIFLQAGFIPAFIATIVVMSYMPYSFACDVKSECMQKVLKSIGNLSWSNSESRFANDELKRSQLFADVVYSTSEDSLLGTYSGQSFKVSELMIGGEGGSTQFKGVLISTKSNKSVKNTTIIIDKFQGSILKKIQPYILHVVIITLLSLLSVAILLAAGSLYILWFFFPIILFGTIALSVDLVKKCKAASKVIGVEKLKKIQLEDPVFEKKFSAYSSDEIEGRYLITTAFMERFVNMKTVFGSKQIKCSFYDDKILFAISTSKNLFEIASLWRPLNDSKFMKKLFDELIAIYLMIDYFKLNENTKI